MDNEKSSKSTVMFDFDNLIPNRIYSFREMYEIGFPFDDFDAPDKEIVFSGELVAKMWAKKNPVLICYFITDDGKKYRLNLWWKGNKRDYCPRHSDICFKAVDTQTLWECTIGTTRNGKIVWDKAEALEE